MRSSTSEPSDTNLGEARRWLGQASDDLRGADRIAGDSEVPARIACFLAHLAAEKALKACLISAEVPFRKIHDLLDIRGHLPASSQSEFADADLRELNPWSIDGRYPGDIDEATRDEARQCVAAAGRVVAAATAVIGAAA